MESLPEDFKHRMKQQLGDDYSAFIRCLQQSPPVSIRINPAKFRGAIEDPVPWSRWGMYLAERPSFTLDPLFHAGAYYVQEASSMFLEQAVIHQGLNHQPLKVLDLCAAPGGKSTHLTSLLHAESLIVANEVIRTRASILSENIQKWGFPNCVVTNNDPRDFQRMPGFFDLIVIDAPCSGEGMFRKDPQAVHEWSAQSVDLCASRQKRILQDVWPALKQNGTLIYCTCTFNALENEENLWYLRQAHDVEFIELPIDPSWGIQKTTQAGVMGYRFFPHRIKGEGFFLSVIRKNETTDSPARKAKNKLTPASKKIAESLRAWLHSSEDILFMQHHELVYMIMKPHADDIDQLFQHLRVVYAGTNAATVKHDKLIPEHSLALSVRLDQRAHESIAVDTPQALQYLRRETPQLPANKKGYTLITIDHVPFGWVNVLQNRINNMYPQEWRIRMT